MPRQSRLRQEIIEYLSTNGPVADPSGRATGVLKDAVGYTGSQAGFIQLIASMAKSGTIEREVRGKRTYEVRVPSALGSVVNSPDREPVSIPSVEVEGELAAGEIDYDELAEALLARVARVISGPEQSSDTPAWARRRLERLETSNAVGERELAKARAELQAVVAERDALQVQLDAAQHNLDLIARRSEPHGTGAKRAARHLGPDDRALLKRLTRETPRMISSERAG